MSLNEETKKIQTFIKAHPQIASLSEKEVSVFYPAMLDKGDVEVSLNFWRLFYVRLIDCIVDHNHLYYVDNKPIISDKEYDELFDYLKKIEAHFPQLISSNSPTQGLIGQVSEGFKQAPHEVKLASLENTYNAEDIKERNQRIVKIVKDVKNVNNEISYRIEPKFDGLSVELVYEKGKLVQAITRGDGLVGDDITSNVKTIKSIPHTLKMPIDIGVRGEIMMPKSVRKDINKEREENGETPFANTRNAAAGSIKLLDSGEVARRKLVCFVYDVLRHGERETDNGTREGISFEALGLPVFDWVRTGKNIDEVVALCEDEKIQAMLEKEDIDFDGLVIKVEPQSLRDLIGSTDHHPRWAVAYKFPAQIVATQVMSVDFQVGRTGIITPVANLEPVELSGVTIKRVSLHNFDFINSKDIRLHDRVWLQRSGEVIPYIVSVIKDRRGTGNGERETTIQPPQKCPSCGEEVSHEDIHYYCRNPHCPTQIKEKIIHFVSKNCMDIEGIGDSTVALLVEQGIIKDVSDIYTLSDPKVQFQVVRFPGFADKKVSEIGKQVEASKKQPLWRLLNGLGIPGVGKKTAIDVIKAVNSEKLTVNNLEDLIKVMGNEEFLRSVYGVGEKIVEGIIHFMKHNKALLRRLEAYGVNFDASKYVEGMLDEENTKGSFSITGTFPVSREMIVQEMQKNGYLFHDSPTKITDLMLIGEAAGSKKKKAESFGLKIYEGRDAVLHAFPFLTHIISEISSKPKAQSLF